MKKKLYVLLACMTLAAVVLGGCGGDSAAEKNPPAEETVQLDDPSLPPLEDDLKLLYAGANQIYSDISFGNFNADTETTITVNDIEYYKVTDDRFATYDDFQKYLEQYFTKDFVSNGILGENNIMFAKGEDGGLYTLGGGRGSNIFYAGHVFEMDRETDKEIDFKATAYYTNSAEAYDGEYFYTAPEDVDNYTTQEFHFILLQEDGQWKFDDFVLFY